MLLDEITNCCKVLKISRNLAENSQELKADSNEEYLLKLLQKELEYRKEVRMNRMMNKANFGAVKTFIDYSFDGIQITGNITMDEIKEARFIDNNNNLVLYGKVGSGKTHMAIAIGVEAIKRGKNVMFFRTATIVNQLVEAKKKGDLKSYLKQFNKLNLIILDEFGFTGFDKEGGQLLFNLISDCYEKRSIIITTNLEFSKWINIFYDEPMTNALIDRIVHHGFLLIFNRDSYRLRNSSMKN